jgi:hypothetical protein
MRMLSKHICSLCACSTYGHTFSITIKVPKCEIFDLFDFNDFYVIKSLQVGDLRAEIKTIFYVGQIRTILSLLVYAQCTLATIFHFELAPNKSLCR